MGWRKATFKDGTVYAEVDEAGALVTHEGRTPIRYQPMEGATIYAASTSRVAVQGGAPTEALPDGVSADAAKDKPKPNPKKPASRGSGFGKAGTRTVAQAAQAREAAAAALASLPADTIVVYTDGACRGNPGPAGSGVVVTLPDGREGTACKALGQATNNIAELTAILVALDLLDGAGVPPAASVVVHTDSAYADGVLTRGWKAKANVELISALRLRLKARPGVKLRWVAGHVGVAGNERADALANKGVQGITELVPVPAAP